MRMRVQLCREATAWGTGLDDSIKAAGEPPRYWYLAEGRASLGPMMAYDDLQQQVEHWGDVCRGRRAE